MAIIKRNMGTVDRIIRSLIGGALIANGIINAHSLSGMLKAFAGGAFIINGISGFDPLLKASGSSTIPGAEDNIINKIKMRSPGQGINPILTQQAIPKKRTPRIKFQKTFASSTAIK